MTISSFITRRRTPAGEDGDFDAKAAAIEEMDRRLPALLELGPDVLVVTGDHSTPSQLRQHSLASGAVPVSRRNRAS